MVNPTDPSDPAGIEIRWLGQAGFALRGASLTVALDPYLSDLCLDVYGLQRATTPPCAAAEIGAELVLVSHWHEDHLDIDSAAELVAAGATYIAPPSCIARLAGRGIAAEALIPIVEGQTVTFAGASVTAVPAIHQVPGFLTEDAVGYLLELDGVRVYHSGDTDYARRLLAAGQRGPIDVALICTNGTGGNMNAWEAAVLAAQLRPGVAVPMHFGMWTDSAYGPGSTLDPDQFRDLYQRLAPGAAVQIPQMAVPFIGRRRGRQEATG